MAQKNILRNRSISLLFSCIAGAINAAFTYRTISNPEANLSSWHVNYDLGFVRRGLQGEILEFITNMTGLGWLWSESILRSIAVAILIYLLAMKALGKHPVRKQVWIFAFFPLGPLYFLFDPAGSGSTDAIFLLFAYLTFWFWNGDRGNFGTIGLVVASTTLSLIHEGYVLFFATLALIVWITKGHKLNLSRFLIWWAAISTPFVIQVVGALILPKVDFSYYCKLATSRNIPADCRPLMFFGEMGLGEAIIFSTTRLSLLPTVVFAIWAIASLVLAIMILQTLPTDKPQGINLNTRIGIALVAYAASLPIFFIGSDWGRWLSVLTMLFVTCFAHFATNPLTPQAAKPIIASSFVPVISGTGSSLAGVAFWLPWIASIF
jgi:hypothetical protein